MLNIWGRFMKGRDTIRLLGANMVHRVSNVTTLDEVYDSRSLK
jgi:hypothetical protein